METKVTVIVDLELSFKSISEIASLIYQDMRVTGFRKKPSFQYCAPYLDAMTCLSNVSDTYGADSGRSVVAYFLGNVQQWKGETAKAIKKELNKRIK